jgi:hypothetical protein
MATTCEPFNLCPSEQSNEIHAALPLVCADFILKDKSVSVIGFPGLLLHVYYISKARNLGGSRVTSEYSLCFIVIKFTGM